MPRSLRWVWEWYSPASSRSLADMINNQGLFPLDPRSVQGQHHRSVSVHTRRDIRLTSSNSHDEDPDDLIEGYSFTIVDCNFLCRTSTRKSE